MNPMPAPRVVTFDREVIEARIARERAELEAERLKNLPKRRRWLTLACRMRVGDSELVADHEYKQLWRAFQSLNRTCRRNREGDLIRVTRLS